MLEHSRWWSRFHTSFSSAQVTYDGHPLMEKSSGVNLEAKSGVRVPEAVCVILSTPATSLKPVVLALAFPLDYFSDVERGDLLVDWVTACPPYYFTQASCPGEDTPALRTASKH